MKCSVIISNRNDIQMLAITVRSALEELSVIEGGGEVVIVDNSDSKYREAVEAVIPQRYLGNKVRLFWQDYPCLFTAREYAARQARGEYIFNIDSHNIFGRDSIKNAVRFMDYEKYTEGSKVGFGHIPLNWLCQDAQASKHDMQFIHGTWGKLYDKECRISWKGQPWICRRDWFLNELGGYGALSEHRLSWGGGDMYLGLKTWLLGFENWAIPSRPVIHIGPLPKVARQWHRYRRYKESGEQFATFGWLVAFYALGVHDDYFDRAEIESFLKNRINDSFKVHLPEAKKLAERDRKWIAERSKLTIWDLYKKPPWSTDAPFDDYVDFGPYLIKYKKKFRVYDEGIAKAIKQEDWYLFQRIVKDYDVKTVLEFGSGLSTLLWQALGIETDSFETNLDFMLRVKQLAGENSNINFYKWNNEDDLRLGAYHLALIDGIDPRDLQIRIAAKYARVVIVHDGYTRPTPEYINNYLSQYEEVKVDSVRSRLFVRR